MLNLSIICVWNLNFLIVSVLNSLIISHCFCYVNLISEGGLMLFNVLSIVRNLFMGDDGLIINIEFFDWDVLSPGLSLGGS